MFSLTLAWANSWTNSRVAGGLRRYDQQESSHVDNFVVTVTLKMIVVTTSSAANVYKVVSVTNCLSVSVNLTHWPLGDLNMIWTNVIFNLALLIGIFKSSYDNVLTWMPQDLTDDKSTLVQVMAWCRQATSHYLNHCWPRSSTPYGVTRPQWVNFVL